MAARFRCVWGGVLVRQPPLFTAMLSRLKTELKSHLAQMKRDPAGERFRNEHRRARRSGATAGWARVLCLVLAVVCCAVGVVLIFIPGPAFVFFILAGALVASQSRVAARALDRAEVKTWALCGWLRKKWRDLRARA